MRRTYLGAILNMRFIGDIWIINNFVALNKLSVCNGLALRDGHISFTIATRQGTGLVHHSHDRWLAIATESELGEAALFYESN